MPVSRVGFHLKPVGFFERVQVEISVQTDATAEQFARFTSETERRCPVTQLFRRSGLELSSSWEPTALQDTDVV